MKAALHADAALREAAESPLMLSVMLGAGDYLRLDNAETTSGGLRTAIWDAYLQNMLNRERKTKAHYPVQQVVQQLPWLAKKMVQGSKTEFTVKKLGLFWLNGSKQKQFWEFAIGMILSFLWLIPSWLLVQAVGEVREVVILWFFSAFFAMVLGGVIGGLVVEILATIYGGSFGIHVVPLRSDLM